MDREIWRIVLNAIRRVARRVRWPGQRDPLYPDWLIMAMYLWSVWHDRPSNWACDRSHYGGVFRPRGRLPSVSQFSRRVRSGRFDHLLRLLHEELMRCGIASPTVYIDGKRLLVGPGSKDPDAGRGRVSGGFAKGYELHAFVNERRRIVVWSVMPLNVAEQSVALALCGHLPPVTAEGRDLVMGDSNYDSAPLHKSLAAQDRALLTPLKAQQRVDPQRGHHPVTLRQMGPARREALALWQRHPDLARYVLKRRNTIEGVFSVLAVALGLDHLPAWARTLGRVRRWVGGKIVLYHARLQAQERLELDQAA